MLVWWLVIILTLFLAVAAWNWHVTQRGREALRTELAQIRAEQRDAEHDTSRLAPASLLAEATLDALILVDNEHRILSINHAARDMFEPPDSPTDQTLIALTRNHEIDTLAADALAGNEDLDRQIEIENRLFRIRALCEGDANEKWVALALRDMTEFHRLSRARREMVANISHELRTPITSIRLLVETLQSGAINDEKQGPRLLDQISAENSILQQMAQELLDLSMIESGQAIMRLVSQPVDEIVLDAVNHLSQQARRKNHTISHKGCEGVHALADPDMIKRVMINLLHNAIKFTPDGGRITVRCKAKDDWLRISVTDNGPGIAFADRERVFERFYRANRARGGPGTGTGLGLAIAKHIVEAHGGHIWAAERPVNKRGARLIFTLPLSDTSPEPAVEQKE